MNSKNKELSRRKFLATASAGAIAAVASRNIPAFGNNTNNAGTLAALGGTPVRPKDKVWPQWPYRGQEVLDSVAKTAQSGIWCRIQALNSGMVFQFEQQFAKFLGMKHFQATGSGTQALHTVVEAMGIGPGDEVITSPYTDPGTLMGILAARALPVLADIDRQSHQIDPDDVERRVTENTKAIMPVHINGQPANMERIMQIAKKHNLKVIEDACQAHMAKYQGKVIGTIGDVGCFSFQSSKIMACGEGGGVVGNDSDFMDKCYTVQNHGTNRKGRTMVIGPKYRMNEFMAALLLGQLPTVMERHARRNENAQYLSSKLKNIPGIIPQKLHEGTDEGSWYCYSMTYDKKEFDGASRAKVIKAVDAEITGIGFFSGCDRGLHREPVIEHILNQKNFQKMYSPQRLQKYRDENKCPNCDVVCEEEAMRFVGSGVLLGTKEDMDNIVNAFEKVYKNRDQLSKVTV
jgi:perosamine synthetase